MTTKSTNTIGIDLSDRTCVACVLDVLGEVVESEKLKLERHELKALAQKHAGSRVIIECGTHSPWVSRWLSKHGMEVVVANPRRVRAIWDASYKSDPRDAELLARIGRVDVRLLCPVLTDTTMNKSISAIDGSRPRRGAGLKDKRGITRHRASRCLGPAGTYTPLTLTPTPRRSGGRYDLSFRKNMEPTI